MKLTAGLLGCALLAPALAGCGSPTSGEPEAVVIRVQGMPPATDKPGLDQFRKMVAEFERSNPGIKVQGSTTVFDPLTFSAKLAGGRVEDVIKVPLTEPQGLIARRQVQPLTKELSGWAHYKEFNPQVLRPLSDTAGEVYGVPQALRPGPGLQP
ncbi:hypothetical protein ACFQYP_24225 [Nonomuraea antimicrobica]